MIRDASIICFAHDWKADPTSKTHIMRILSESNRITLQSDLKNLGYDPGDIDGVLGRKVRAALRKYQRDHRLPADGSPSQEMLGRLNAEMRARGL